MLKTKTNKNARAYKVEYCPSDKVESWLNLAYENGWKLHSAVPLNWNFNDKKVMLVFEPQ